MRKFVRSDYDGDTVRAAGFVEDAGAHAEVDAAVEELLLVSIPVVVDDVVGAAVDDEDVVTTAEQSAPPHPS